MQDIVIFELFYFAEPEKCHKLLKSEAPFTIVELLSRWSLLSIHGDSSVVKVSYAS